MSVYASPSVVQGGRHPRALLLIVGAHAVLIGAVMTARMAIPIIDRDPPLVFHPVPIPPDPPPIPEPPNKDPQPRKDPAISKLDQPPPILRTPTDDRPTVDNPPIPIPDRGPVIGTNPDPVPIPKPIPAVVRTGPRFITPDWALRPPYPADKQRLEEEATLKLRLTIDGRGRVIDVEPVGPADPSFLRAAQKHLMASWRYKPATEDGRPVTSSTVITLRFELE